MLKFAAQNKIYNCIEILINFKRLNIWEMKKKYFAPEMEELELDEPVVLTTEESSGGESGTHDEEGGDAL